jgi:transcriptional regulator with XRE-family HTH domain
MTSWSTGDMVNRRVDRASQQALDELGEALRDARHQRAWSQRVLERYSGVDQTTISRLERGLAPGLRTEAIARIRQALRSAREPW